MSTKTSRRFWLWVTRPQYYLDEDGSDRAELGPSARARRGEWWSCHEDTHKGDLILFYRTAPRSDIAYLVEAASNAYKLDPEEVDDPNWEFGCYARVLRKFSQPLTLREIRADPKLQKWTPLRQNFQRQVFPIEQSYWQKLRQLLAKRNPNTFDGVDDTSGDHDSPDRPLVVVRRQLRDSAFGRRVRRASQGKCAVCLSDTDYEQLRILEAAHIRGVEYKGPDELSNALALCPNHHALFDEGKWTLNGKKIVLARDLPDQIRETFAGQIKSRWKLNPKEIDWHRENIFGKRARPRIL